MAQSMEQPPKGPWISALVRASPQNERSRKGWLRKGSRPAIKSTHFYLRLLPNVKQPGVMTMTAQVTRISDYLRESSDNGKVRAIGYNSSNPSNMCVGSRLRVKRTARGISRQELSNLLRIDCDHLDAYEAGAERMNANLLLRIAKLLDVRPDYFFRNYTEEELEGCLESSFQ
jgi:hypothetical protein